MGQKQKTEERERKKERLNNGNNNGQATHGACIEEALDTGKETSKSKENVTDTNKKFSQRSDLMEKVSFKRLKRVS